MDGRPSHGNKAAFLSLSGVVGTGLKVTGLFQYRNQRYLKKD